MSYTDKKMQSDLLHNKILESGELTHDLKKKIQYKFRLDWNYYSNSMEGNTLTMDETRSVMVGNLTVGGKPFKDVIEMKGHDEIITEILKIGKGELRLSESRIKEIHKGIMHEEDEVKQSKIGKWKTEPNYIYNYKNERFDFVAPIDVPERMHDLLNKTNAAIDAIKQGKTNAPHPLDVALQFHLEYITIHPFYDGNGRTARILTNLLLILFGYPPFWVKTNERGIYNQYIGDIQGYGGKPDLFYEFVTGLIMRSQQLVLDAIEGKDLEEPDDIDKRIDILKRKLDKSDVVTDKKSISSTNEVLKKNIFPLLQHLEEKLEKLKVLFHSTDRQINYTANGKYSVLAKDDSTWREIEEEWMKISRTEHWDTEIFNLYKIDYSFLFKGYKKALSLQYLPINIAIEFSEFDYRIKLTPNSQDDKVFGYGKIIDEQIIHEMVRGRIDGIIDQIAKASGIEGFTQ